MCGIAGFTNFNQRTFDIKKIIEDMTRALYRRGPDGEGFYIKNDIVLGHRRLSIIDISAGKQPMTTDNGRYVITFNGEIYNYLELRESLLNKGYKFKTKSDTEVLLYMFSEYGSSCLEKLNGMFAFAIWDSLNKELFLARDRVGKKPLYYTMSGKDLVFTSELKSLVLYPDFDKTLNSDSFFEYFYFGYFPCPKSVFKNTYKLEPGHYLSFKNGNVSINKYWGYADIKVDKEINSLSFNEAAEHLEKLITDSIRLRVLASDVPVGVSLSGGVDSSLISALATNTLGKIKTYSIYFQEKEFDESPYIKQVVKRIGSEHYYETVTATKMFNLMSYLPEILDEPMGDSSIIPTTFVNQIASKNVKVLLGGDGSDELFCGYGAYSSYRALNKLPQCIPFVVPLLNILRTLRPLMPSLLQLYTEKIINRLRVVSGETRDYMFMLIGRGISAEYISSFLKLSRADIKIPTRKIDSLNDAIDIYIGFYLLNDILVKTDRASMYNSLELRAPFLDFRVVNFAQSLPDLYKINDFENKRIVKKIARKYLPREIIYRRKKGFSIPQSRWLRHELYSLTREISNDLHSDLIDCLEVKVIKSFVEDYMRGAHNYSNLIWALIVLNKWAYHYL